MSLKKQKLLMATPAVTREYTPGSCCNSIKPRIRPPRREMWTDSPALGAEQFRLPSKHVRSLDLLDGTTESPREVRHKPRRTLMSPQECEIDQCSPNQLEMMKNFPCIGFRAMPHSPSYRTIGLASFGQLQRFPETPISHL